MLLASEGVVEKCWVGAIARVRDLCKSLLFYFPPVHPELNPACSNRLPPTTTKLRNSS
jgi:hypothetical protein